MSAGTQAKTACTPLHVAPLQVAGLPEGLYPITPQSVSEHMRTQVHAHTQRNTPGHTSNQHANTQAPGRDTSLNRGRQAVAE